MINRPWRHQEVNKGNGFEKEQYEKRMFTINAVFL